MGTTSVSGRTVVEMYEGGINIHDWEYWKKNYIAVMCDIARGKQAIDTYDDVVFYVREYLSMRLSPALKLSDIPYNTHPKQPGDMQRVAFEDMDDHLYRPDNGRDYLHFDYSPSSGYEIPSEDVLSAPLTLEALKGYTKYYIEDREGFRALRDADFEGYRLVDKRSMWRGEYNDAWAITRGPQEEREVLMVDGTWLRVDSPAVHWGFVKDYPKFSFKLKVAIKMIGEFLADSQEDIV